MSPRRGAPGEKLFYPSVDLRGCFDKALEIYNKIEPLIRSSSWVVAIPTAEESRKQQSWWITLLVGVPRNRIISETLSISTIENVLHSGGFLHTIIGGQPKKRRSSHDEY